MIARTHPDIITLKEFSEGSASPVSRMLMEAHLFQCEQCEKAVRVTRMALEENPDPAESSLDTENLFGKISNQLNSQVRNTPSLNAILNSDIPFPAQLKHELPGEIHWDWVNMWPSKGRIALVHHDFSTDEALYCVHYKAGSIAPAHRHSCREDTVMVRGGYSYNGVEVHAGDWDSVHPGSTHAPEVFADSDCWCLVRVERKDSPLFIGSSSWRRPLVSLLDLWEKLRS